MFISDLKLVECCIISISQNVCYSVIFFIFYFAPLLKLTVVKKRTFMFMHRFVSSLYLCRFKFVNVFLGDLLSTFSSLNL